MSISLLIPSRGKPKVLKAAICSLLNTADKKHTLEFIIKLDDGDIAHTEYFDEIVPINFSNITIKTTPKEDGWKSLGKFFNDLAQHSMGQWLWVLNDDIEMKTQGWDEIIQSFEDKPCVINPHGQGLTLFPIVNRKFYNILERIGLDENPHVDTYLQDVSGGSNTLIRTDKINIQHLKSHPESGYGETSTHYYSKEIQDLVKKDIEKIKNYLTTM